MLVRITAFAEQSHFYRRYPSYVGQVFEIDPSPHRQCEGVAGYQTAYIQHPEHRYPPGEWCKGLRYEPPDQPLSQENQTVQISGIELYPDGAYKVTRSQLSPTQVAAALRASANEQGTIVNSAFEVDGQPARLSVTQERLTAGVRLMGLKINTYFLLVDGHLVPTFNQEGGAVSMSCDWKAPETMRLYVAVNMHFGGGIYTADEGGTLMFAKGPNGHPVGYFRLPLPNTYQDGRICLGRGFMNAGATIEAVLKNALRQLREGSWNTDLMDYCNQAHARKLFRFNPATCQSVAPAGDWSSLCVRVSRVEMDQMTTA